VHGASMSRVSSRQPYAKHAQVSRDNRSYIPRNICTQRMLVNFLIPSANLLVNV
jgi:hypothetical protein